jgi:hypothetical protein
MNWKPNTEGIFYDLPAETYHQAPGVSHTMLKAMHPTPAHLEAYLREKFEPTAAMMLGTLTHTFLLGGDTLPRLAVKPEDMKFSTKEGKAWKAQQLKEGKLIVSTPEYDSLIGMVSSIGGNEDCKQILGSTCRTEVSAFKNFNRGGTCLRKCRYDIVPEGNALTDIKTSINASPEAFAKDLLPVSAGGKGYGTQAAYYLDIWNDSVSKMSEQKTCFVFIVVEKTAPYLVAIYNVYPRALGKCRTWNIERLSQYIFCKSTGVFPGYHAGIQEIDLPEWFYKQSSRNLF